MSTVATPRRGVQWNDDVVTAMPAGAVALAVHPTGSRCRWRGSRRPCGASSTIPRWTPTDLAPWAADDRELHLAQGLDPDAVLAEIDAARDELEAAWRPLAARFVEVAVHHR